MQINTLYMSVDILNQTYTLCIIFEKSRNVSVESHPQNHEFRNNPENFHLCM